MDATSSRIWRLGSLLGGLSGLVYILTEMLISALVALPLALPFRWWASLVLGERTFSSAHVVVIVFVGLLVVGVASALSGTLFAAFVHRFPGLAATPGTLIIAGASYGGALWLWVVAVMPNLAWPWFAQAATTPQFVAFVVGYGVSLGVLFVLERVHRPAELE